MSARFGWFGSIFRDPYADLVVSQLLSPKDALSLSKAEFEILMAAARSEILTSPAIRSTLTEKLKITLEELKSARQHFPK